ncbi:MAG: serine/threonine-protein kinase, partial [Streptosporangiaceae bacterium]
MQAGVELGGRYALADMLGSGGMGEVWRAFDRQLDRPVAVKVLRDRYADPLVARRFQQEARIAARLQHSGIAVVHDVGEHDGQLFIVMELLRGEDLAAMLRRAPAGLPLATVVSVAAQAAEALAALIRSHLNTTPVSVRKIRPDVPRRLDRLVCDLLAKKPADRPSDAGQVASILRSIAGKPPSQDSSRSTVTAERGTQDTQDAWWRRTGTGTGTGTGAIRPSRRPRRPKVLAISGAGVLAVVGAVTGIILATASPSHPNAGTPRAPSYRLLRSLANPGNGKYSVRFVAFSPDGRTVAAPSGDGRTYLWDPATGHQKATLTDTGTGSNGIAAVAFSPDSQTLATADTNGHAYLWDVGTRDRVATLTDTDGGSYGIWALAFSPDGKT